MVQTPAFLQARAVQYEIHALVEGRWRIDGIVTAEGAPVAPDPAAFDKLEAEAIERATALLGGTGGIAAVKVVRERRRADGFTTTREIFAREAPPAPKQPPLAIARLRPSAAGTGWCDSVADLYRRDACRLISLLLRGFLDRLSITPLELLHYAPYLRKLEDNWGLVSAAVSRVAQLQAAAGGVGARTERIKMLIDEAKARAREAQSVRRLPVYAGDFPAWTDAIATRIGEGEARFYLHVAVARHLAGVQGYGGRLEFALGGLEQAVSGAVAAELDAYAAGCLESPALVMDLLGHQPSLAAALIALAELAQGRPAVNGAPEIAVRLQRQLCRGALPGCVPVLWERIERELALAKPLSHDGTQEWHLLMRLRDELPEAAPAAWRAPIEAALGERVRRAREVAA